MDNKSWRAGAIGAVLTLCSTLCAADVLSIDLLDVNGYDLQGDPSNEVALIDMAGLLGLAPGTPLQVDGIGWDVTIATQGFSWLSEATVEISDSAGSAGVVLTPGLDHPNAGTMHFANGIVDLVALGLDFVLADGILRVEFFETFDDVPDSVDAIWNGSLEVSAQTAVIPLPAALWLMIGGLAGLAGLRRQPTRSS